MRGAPLIGSDGRRPRIVGRADLLGCGAIMLQGYDYWQGLCVQHGRLPARADLRPQEIPGLLSRLILLELFPEGHLDPRYRLAGTRFEELNGARVTGRYIREVYLPPDCEEMLAAYRDFVAEPAPRYLESQLRRPGRQMYRIRRLMLPFTDGTPRVAFLVGIIDESPSFGTRGAV